MVCKTYGVNILLCSKVELKCSDVIIDDHNIKSTSLKKLEICVRDCSKVSES